MITTPPLCLGASVCCVSTLAFMAAACGVLSPEEQLLNDFFEASRLHDTTMVAKMSSVTFNPRIEGVVQTFDVDSVANQGDSKLVTVRASIRSLEGTVTERILVFTLMRKGDRWFITGLGGP